MSAARQRKMSREDSFVISDSEDEDDSPVKKNATAANAQIINDSDTEGDPASNSDSKSENSEDENKNDSIDSEEEEDRQFMNSSHMVSIVEHSSESDSDSIEEEPKSNKLKRRSIYENPVKSNTPRSESTPVHGIKRKRIKAVISSDSESENVSADHTNKGKFTNKSKMEVLQHNLEDKSDENESEESEEPHSPIPTAVRKQIKAVISSDSESEILSAHHKNKEKSINRSGMKVLQYSFEEDSHKEELKEPCTPLHSRMRGIDSQLPSRESPILKERNTLNIKRENSVIDLTMSDDLNEPKSGENSYDNDKKSNVVDLTLDRNYENTNSKVKNDQRQSNEVLISSSTSNSENEIDNEVLEFVKKEVGVGNIDPLEAQKKEHYLLQIDMLQKQADKLKKFVRTCVIEELPDNGVKVREIITSTDKKISVLREKLSKLSRKTSDKTRKSQLPTVKTESLKDIKKSISSIESTDEDKENFDGNKKIVAKNSNKNRIESSSESDNFDVRDIPNVPQTSFDANELGKKALATLNKQQSLTAQRLEQLHGSLTSRPADDAKEKDPYGLKIPLMPHQQHALAWMKWREQQKPKGGILADDMGLGKTLTMISLILATMNEKESDSDDTSSDEEWLSKKKHKRYYGGTLVVCPASLIKQWEAEVKNRCKRGLLNVLVFHGNKRAVDDRKLAKFNIVVTTYQTLVREAELESGMYKMEWNRVILDEAHYVRNHKSKACIAVCGVSAKYRWALSGTPIQNKELDLYAILKFLKCSPFDDLQVWRRWVDNKNDAGKQRLVTIMKTIMLRRTKQELQAKGTLDSLPDKFIDIIEIEMDRDETLPYQKILLFSQNLFAQFLSQRADKQHMKELHGGKFNGNNYGAVTQFTKAQKVLLAHHSSIEAYEILVLLLRLRQMCCHPALLHAMLDKEDAEVNGILEQDDDSNKDLLQRLSNMSITEEDGEVDEHAADYKIDEKIATNLLTKRNPVFDDDRRSSKVRKIIKTVKDIIDKDEKLIIVSQWSSFLKVIAKHLRDIEGAKYEYFTGEVPVKKRQDIVDRLNNPREDTNILLLSLTAGGVGLNLVGANHLLLIDIHWNPQLEAQAQDRIYRFGQKKNVHVYKFICKETIEERVKALQDKKLEIANHVLTGSRSVSAKLTIEDLKMLFS